MLKNAIVQGIDNIDGRFGSIISINHGALLLSLLNFGEIYPYLNFYDEDGKIEQYQLNQNPATKDREWIVTFKNDASLGGEAWLCYGEGREGKQMLFFLLRTKESLHQEQMNAMESN